MGRKTVDIIGKRFDRLVVVSKTDKKASNGSYYYECKCDCGNKIDVYYGNLRQGNIKSCGCMRAEMAIQKGKENANKYIKDITNHRFGRLVAEKRMDNKGLHTYYWLCKCDCGKYSIVELDDLQQGNTKSCGCLKKESCQAQVVIMQKKLDEEERVENTCLCNLTQKVGINNTSGCKGVTYNSRKKLWKAFITFQGKERYLGSFKNIEDAINARKEGEEKYFEPILEKYGRSIAN